MREMSVREQLHGFPDDLENALGWKPNRCECDGVLLCGMGGSAISGAIVADFYSEKSAVPLVTVKDYSIPAWAGEKTLAIVSSYSGNTLETLKMYESAKKAGCRIVALTSGGKLKDMCERDGHLVKPLPQNMQPRHSIGFMIGYTMALLDGCGCVCVSDRMNAVVESVKGFRDYLESPEGDEMIDRMVDEMSGCVPVIMASGPMQSVAFRWKTQINENSKFVAFCGSFSEYNCDSICEWAQKNNKNMALVTIGAFGENVAVNAPRRVIVNEERGDLVEEALRSLMIGDYVSMRMAEKRGIDPESVIPIKSLKKKLSQMPDFDRA
jgi:glucose/mannose-6-phosphate isomerase